MLQFMGLQKAGHDWATELNWTAEEIDQSTIIVIFHTHLSESGTKLDRELARSPHNYQPTGYIDIYRIVYLTTANYTLFL